MERHQSPVIQEVLDLAQGEVMVVASDYPRLFGSLVWYRRRRSNLASRQTIRPTPGLMGGKPRADRQNAKSLLPTPFQLTTHWGSSALLLSIRFRYEDKMW